MAKGTKRAGYSPDNVQNPTDALKSGGRDAAGYGGTDGVQSEASREEARKYLVEGGMKDGNHRVETGWSKKTRYTGDFNAG